MTHPWQSIRFHPHTFGTVACILSCANSICANIPVVFLSVHYHRSRPACGGWSMMPCFTWIPWSIMNWRVLIGFRRCTIQAVTRPFPLENSFTIRRTFFIELNFPDVYYVIQSTSWILTMHALKMKYIRLWSYYIWPSILGIRSIYWHKSNDQTVQGSLTRRS